MEPIPGNPLVLQQRLAAAELENAQLHNQVDEQDSTIVQLRRTIYGRDAAVKTLKDSLGHDEAVDQLAEANATIVGAEFDVQHALSARGVFRQIIESYRQLRITTALQQNAVVGALIGRLQAEENRDAAIQERDVMKKERDTALQRAESTNILRTLYEQGMERSRSEIAEARQSEAEAWARADEFSGVHAQNELLVTENAELRISESEARERADRLEDELAETRSLLAAGEDELERLRKVASNKSPEFEVLEAELLSLKAVAQVSAYYSREVSRLTRENTRLHAENGGLRAQTGKTHGINLLFLATRIPHFGPRLAVLISEQSHNGKH